MLAGVGPGAAPLASSDACPPVWRDPSQSRRAAAQADRHWFCAPRRREVNDMPAERVDHVIGVDTHRDVRAAAIVAAPSGALEVDTTIAANPIGYQRLLRFGAPARTRSARVGDRIVGQLRRRPGHVPARARRVGGRGRAPGPSGAAQRRQVLPARRLGPTAAREALTREHRAQPLSRGSRGGARAAGHPPRRDVRRARARDQLAQGAGRHRPRRAPPPTART